MQKRPFVLLTWRYLVRRVHPNKLQQIRQFVRDVIVNRPRVGARGLGSVPVALEGVSEE